MEIMSEDGTMARLPELRQMADEHGLKLISIHDLIVYRLKQESIVEKRSRSKYAYRTRKVPSDSFPPEIKRIGAHGYI